MTQPIDICRKNLKQMVSTIPSPQILVQGGEICNVVNRYCTKEENRSWPSETTEECKSRHYNCATAMNKKVNNFRPELSEGTKN